MPRTRQAFPAEQVAAVLEQLPAAIAILRGPEFRVDLANARFREVGERFVRAHTALLEQVRSEGRPAYGGEAAVDERYWDFSLLPLRDGLVVHAVDVTRQVEARRRAESSERLYRALVDSNVVGVTLTGEDELLEANDAFLEMVGHTRADLAAGLRWTDISAPESAEVDREAMERLRREGIAPAFEKEYVRRDGSRVPVMLSGTRVGEDPLVVLATIYDLTERRAVEREIQALLESEREARHAAEVAVERTGRLQQITAGLSAARSPDEIARVVVHHAIEAVSASAGMLVRVDGTRVTVAHAVGYDPGVIERWRRFPLAAGTPLTECMLERAPVVVDTPEEMGRRYPAIDAEDSRHASQAAFPLLAGGRILGAIGLSFRKPRALSGRDREFLLSISRQAAAAFDRAQLYENRAYVASKLQEGLLPERLAEIPGVQSAVRYSSIAGSGQVGGDFYDLFEAGEGRWALALGDVCGKGTEAAVVTGLARHTVRALARLRDCPADVLAFLNDELRRYSAAPPFCTVGCAILRRDAAGFTATLASGGHPYPLVLRAGGAVEEVRVGGTMLGVTDDPHLEDVDVVLGPGDALVMYTDGVTEGRGRGGEPFGEERLRAAIAGARGGGAEEIAAAIDSAVLAHAPGAPSDDRALVVLAVARL